jgi:hypothetical protein
MKKILIFSYLGLLCSFIAWSQEPTPIEEVISSAGNSWQSDNMQIEWTIGESITEIFNNYSSLLITQGLHQGFDVIIEEPPLVETLDPVVLRISSALVGGNVTGSGGSVITNRGVYMGSEPDPLNTGQKIQLGMGMGVFTHILEELTPGANYYIVAYATNSEGTSFGTELSFCTVTLPVVVTAEASEITKESARVGGEVSCDGAADLTEKGVYWGTEPDPAVTGFKLIIGSGLGVFTETLENLQPGTLYYVQAYAVNGEGTSLGNQIIFETLPDESIPATLWVDELTVVGDQDTCFSASEIITVAGNGNAVEVNSGGSLLLVAGQSIHLMDGFRVFSGGKFQAWISVSGEFCTNSKSILATNDEDILQQIIAKSENITSLFKVYPNPTSGMLTLEFAEVPEAGAKVEIFSMIGELLYHTEVSGDARHSFDLTRNPKGIYIFRVLIGTEFMMEKVIKK